jgi:hypothetical protein
MGTRSVGLRAVKLTITKLASTLATAFKTKLFLGGCFFCLFCRRIMALFNSRLSVVLPH